MKMIGPYKMYFNPKKQLIKKIIYHKLSDLNTPAMKTIQLQICNDEKYIINYLI